MRAFSCNIAEAKEWSAAKNRVHPVTNNGVTVGEMEKW